MEQIIAKYLEDGIAENQIIYYCLDDMENENLLDYKSLYETIKSRLNPKKMNYIFLDEIQGCQSVELNNLYPARYYYYSNLLGSFILGD